MREVYAIGVGITSFSRLDYPLTEIACYPAMLAMRDCGIHKITSMSPTWAPRALIIKRALQARSSTV
jgi:hypothetical protein